VVPAEGEYGPVSDGETLWGIASNWSRGTGIDINQVMIAIQQENPGAFMKGNINLLKRGAILRMPRMEDVRAISTAAAIQAVSEQAQEFQGGAATASVASPAAPLMAEDTNVPEVAGDRMEDEVSAMEEDAEAAEAVAGELMAEEEMDEELGLAPQLELVPPSEESDLDSAAGLGELEDEAADAAIALSALREDLARTEEDLVSQQQQNEYLEQRIRELESQLASAEADNVADGDMANMEERLRQQRQAEEAARKASEQPWYSGVVGWLIGLLVIGAAVGAWIFNRRRWAAEFEAAGEGEQLREIKDEAEEVLRVLRDPETPDKPEAPEAEEISEDAAKEPEKAPRERKPFGHGSGDAEVLDEESSDPEIQLDLARAYISMGDKEAARVILEEVQNNGNEQQQAEANKMLNRLTS
jgi:pilus assembly protein FimV